MLAVLKTGGKQYAVREQDTIVVERIAGDVGMSVELHEVLLLKDGERVTLGKPVVKGAVVEAEITAQPRGEKIRIVKFKRRKHYRKQMGHRQELTELRIRSIRGAPEAQG